jgi:3-hydroxybutyryl-CoA dehydrogenase
MTYAIVKKGESRSFPEGDAFLTGGAPVDSADIVIYLGASYRPDNSKTAILVELGTECLGVHTGEMLGDEGSNILGFSRYRIGDDAPSPAVELVIQPRTAEGAVKAAQAMFEAAGLTVVVCNDQAGRILDRLVRPKYNAALKLLDEGLATQKDIDLTCKLGLGYPEGPLERVTRGGLDRHYDVSKALFEIYGTPGYAPARRAVVAAQRRKT